MRKGTPVQTLQANLGALMLRHELSGYDVSRRSRELAKRHGRTGVDPKTVNNMLNGRVAPNINSVHAVAQVFGLQGYELQIPGFAAAQMTSTGQELEKILAAFSATDETGRHSILTVAEIAARVTHTGEQR